MEIINTINTLVPYLGVTVTIVIWYKMGKLDKGQNNLETGQKNILNTLNGHNEKREELFKENKELDKRVSVLEVLLKNKGIKIETAKE